MSKTIKIWISLSQDYPHYYAMNEADLKAYIDHLNSIGFNSYSYDEDKARGFVQDFEISEKRLAKIEAAKFCHLWFSKDLKGWTPCPVIALSDTMNDVATQVSKSWNQKVSKQHLLTQYGIIPNYTVEDISGFNVKEFKHKLI